MTETQPQAIQKLINDPDALITELVEGMVSAHPDMLRTDGATGRAIVAVDGPRPGKVGIVVGGGSGHEPAFAGYVGRGLADAAPLGNIFASPSPSQILDAAHAADGGEGVLFLYGNYTGDVMNFDMAAERLAAQGVKARSFVTTDDVASAPKERAAERRGIAGNFFVFKAAGAAADLGRSFDEVEAAARLANANTLTMGVALSACSMPQTAKFNFHIPAGEMEVGMGIHGEPGVERAPIGTANEVADRLIDPILAEMPLDRDDEVAVLVNGLGATTLLELYLLHRRVAEILKARKVTIHHSWVGEYCTSLEMAGASITLMKLTDDLKELLDHPCRTPALQVGTASETAVQRDPVNKQAEQVVQTPAGQPVQALKSDGPVTPPIFRRMLIAAGARMIAERDALCVLDGAIGDGDHGVTMDIGWKAAIAAIKTAGDNETITLTCRRIADAFLEAVGASAGPLYATGFEAAGTAVADRLNLDAKALAAWIDGMAVGIKTRGGAAPGDKTMIDAWVPAASAASRVAQSGGDCIAVLSAAAQAAEDGAESTKDMQSQRGRSSKLGLRSVGHIDPGAASAAMIVAALNQALAS